MRLWPKRKVALGTKESWQREYPKQEREHQFRQFTASLAIGAFSQSWTENNLNENSITVSWENQRVVASWRLGVASDSHKVTAEGRIGRREWEKQEAILSTA